MKPYLLFLAFSFSLTISAQQMTCEKGKIYFEGKQISLNEAQRKSRDVSDRAYQQFKYCRETPTRQIQIGAAVFGSVAIISGIQTLGNSNSGSGSSILIGSTIMFGGGSLMEFIHRSNIQKGVDYYNDDFLYRAERERAEQRRLEEVKRKQLEERIAERNRIERFYATLTERLNQPLESIEGVYKSIDNGEQYEYDIAILKSINDDQFIGVVLESTDPSLTIGDGLFNFTPTAQSDLYFVRYQSKAGKLFTNKTAQLSGAVLTMGLKSFIKMYPSENDQRQYTEINPLFDWESSGSGVLLNNEGIIVTNNHVASGAKKIRVSFQNDSIEYNAIILSQNEQTDVAILKIDDERFTSELKPVNWNTSFNLGQKVFTLGYPISDKMSSNVKVVDGIVSGENGLNGDINYFQTTLPVWYGNSGGPCFNSKGEILGLATQILWDRGEKVDNVAYITKTENILKLAGNLIQEGNPVTEDKSLEELIDELIPYSVFIKINY